MSNAVIDSEDIPFGDDKKYSLIVPASISPTGGLIEIEALGGSMFDVNEPSVAALLDKHNIKTKRDALMFLMIVKSLHDSRIVTFLIGNLIYLGLINMDDVFELYLAQAEKQMYNSLTLEDIFQIHHRVDDYRKKENGERETNAVSLDIRERIIAVANRVIEVSETDLQLFYEQWYYRTERTDLSPEFTRHWYDQSLSRHVKIHSEGKLFSLIAFECHRVAPDHVTLDDLFRIISDLCMSSPESHGIHRYLGLCFRIANDDKEKTKLVYLKSAEVITDMIKSGHRREAELHFEMFMGYTDINDEDKEGMRLAVMKKIDEEVMALLNYKATVRNYRSRG